MSTIFDNVLLIIGGVSATPLEHIADMRADGCSEGCINYFIAHAIGRYADGERANETTVTHEQYARWRRSFAKESET